MTQNDAQVQVLHEETQANKKSELYTSEESDSPPRSKSDKKNRREKRSRRNTKNDKVPSYNWEGALLNGHPYYDKGDYNRKGLRKANTDFTSCKTVRERIDKQKIPKNELFTSE